MHRPKKLAACRRKRLQRSRELARSEPKIAQIHAPTSFPHNLRRFWAKRQVAAAEKNFAQPQNDSEFLTRDVKNHPELWIIK
jgi:hypothetical protein